MDDSYVETVSESTVLKQRDVYVLFYSRKEVKLEFPPPPREPVLKNGVKNIANPTIDKSSASSKRGASPTPEVNGSSKKKSAARSLEYDSSSSSDGPASPSTPKTTATVSPRSDSSAIKHANEAESQSSSSDSSDSDSSTSEKKKHLVDIKKSLEYAAKVQTPSSSGKAKTTPKPVKVMKGKNVEVVLSRNKKRPWKPQEATKLNSAKGNVLLGNYAIEGWDDNTEMSISKKSKKGNQDGSLLRDLASKTMEAADRSRKREMHLDKWDAGIDEGKVRVSLTSNTCLLLSFMISSITTLLSSYCLRRQRK
jgi:hypothetical protein